MRAVRACVLGVLLALVGGVQAQDAVQPANRFGAVEAFLLPEQACALGLGWERIIFDWAQQQPDGPESWNPWNVPDEWLQAASACNREVVAVVKHTPAWATDGTPGIGVPRGLYLDVDDPGNLWAGYIRRMAAYYGERGVSRFIIWNEPDIPAGVYGYEFEGSIEDYARLLQVAYTAARQANADAHIILAGTTYWHDVNAGRALYVERLLRVLEAMPEAQQNGYYFDALALHIYFRTDTVYPIVHAFTDILRAHGLSDKAIWIVETNASPNLDPLWPVTRPQYQITLDQQSAFVVQAAALGLAAGADRIGVYKFFDWTLPPGAESFGLIRADESLRPAYTAWGTVIREMSGAARAAYTQTDSAALVRIDRADGQVLWVAWARGEAPVVLRLPPTGESGQLSDAYGNIVTVAGDAQGITLALPPASCNRRDGCAVGGMPALLLQPAAEGEVLIEQSGAWVPMRFEEEMRVDAE